MKSLIRQAAGHLSYYGGLVALVRSVRPRNGAVILMGHRVRDDDDAFFGGIPLATFDRQIRYLAGHYRFLSLTHLLDHIRQQRPVLPNSVVLTFDDGWRDNYTHALPVLRKHGVPATIYLVTDSVEKGELPWPQRIGYVLQHTERSEVALPSPVRRGFRLATVEQRRRALTELKELRLSLSQVDLEQLARELSERCGVVPPLDRMLTWHQVREMRQYGIEFGAHTVSHPLMAQLPLDEARWQLAESKRIIEERLGEPVRHFAFPGGSCNAELIELARQVGFESLFVRDRTRRVNTHRSSPFALTRLGTTSDPVPVVATEMAGVFDWVRRAAR